VSASGVIENVDVFQEGDFHFPTGLPISTPDQFGLEGFEKALDGRVVIAIALATHRRGVVAGTLAGLLGTQLANDLDIHDAAQIQRVPPPQVRKEATEGHQLASVK
jgi:hypothetical protein